VALWYASEEYAWSASTLAVARLINNRKTITAVREFRERQNFETVISESEYNTGNRSNPDPRSSILHFPDVTLTNSTQEIGVFPTTAAEGSVSVWNRLEVTNMPAQRLRTFWGWRTARVTAAKLVLVLACVAMHGQVPDQFTNLQYFPKTVSREELIATMRGFCFGLGVRCQYCHAGKEGGSLNDMNFASDEKETKNTARAMLRMVDAINQDYIAKLGSRTSNRVECVTCHHGLSKPKTMNAILAEAVEKNGIDAAIALYRDLRSKDFGEGQYDFGETPLNQLTESLLKQKKTQAAVAIMELNVEVNTPPSLWSYNLLAMAHKANNQTEKAKADFQKILELNPKDDFARKQLDQLNATKR
jgi:hypothetical protein